MIKAQAVVTSLRLQCVLERHRYPSKLLAASRDVLSGAIGRGDGFRHSSLHQSVDVSKDVTLLPPVFVAEECEVGAGATVGSRTSIGKGCTIGERAHIEGSVLFEGVRVGEGTVIRNSIVGPGAIIHGGCIVRGLSVLGAGCVVEEGNVLDQGARVNPRVQLSKGVLSF